MRAIFKRELQGYFLTPIGYVFMFVFLSVSGILFTLSNINVRSSEILTLLGQFSLMWMVLSPVLTMRLLAGERQKGTDQLLYATPVRLTNVVMGKFLAACTVLMITVALSMAYVAIIAIYSRVYIGEIFVGYLGFILQGCAFIALDMAVTSMARSPVTATLLAFLANITFWLMDLLAASVSSAALADALQFISLYQRYEPFVLGQLSPASILYYLSFSALMLFFAVRALDARRFSEA